MPQPFGQYIVPNIDTLVRHMHIFRDNITRPDFVTESIVYMARGYCLGVTSDEQYFVSTQPGEGFDFLYKGRSPETACELFIYQVEKKKSTPW